MFIKTPPGGVLKRRRHRLDDRCAHHHAARYFCKYISRLQVSHSLCISAHNLPQRCLRRSRILGHRYHDGNNRVFVCNRVSRTAARSCDRHLFDRPLFTTADINGVTGPYTNADVDDAWSNSDSFA